MLLVDIIFWALSAASILVALGVVFQPNVFRGALLLVLVFLSTVGFFVLLNAEFLAVVQVLIYVGAIAVLIVFITVLTGDVQRGNLPNRALHIPAVLASSLLVAAIIFVAVSTDWNVMPNTAEEMGVTQQELNDVRFYLRLDRDQLDEAVQRDPGLPERVGTVLRQHPQLLAQIVQVNTLSGVPDHVRELLAEPQRQAVARSGIAELLINDYVLAFEVASVLLLAAIVGALVLVRERRA